MPRELRNEGAWKALFEKYHIVDEIDKNGVFEISASSINEFREARLMTKFDHLSQLPTCFKNNNLSIQPNTRGTYVIGPFESYSALPALDTDKVEHLPFPSGLETIDPCHIYSEASAILCAQATGMFDSIFSDRFRLTVLGRMSTGTFAYRILNNRTRTYASIDVDCSQCEIDAGLEGEAQVVIVEAKNEAVSDFLIRQLYYPYRLWRERVSKPIIPVFMTYSNEIFSFYVFEFRTLEDYNSLELVAQHNFRIAPNQIELRDIRALTDKATIEKEDASVPFPQANNFLRVVDLLNRLCLAERPLTKQDITERYSFDARQTQYYTAALRYLGLVTRRANEEGVCYQLSGEGRRIMSLHPDARNLALAKRILSHQVFLESLKKYFDLGQRPAIDDVVGIMRSLGLALDRNGTTTLARRAQTVLSWLDWILRLTH